MTLPRAFAAWKKKATSIEHVEKCTFTNSSVPMNECPCDCYERSIFAAGYFMGRGIAPRVRILNKENRAERG